MAEIAKGLSSVSFECCIVAVVLVAWVKKLSSNGEWQRPGPNAKHQKTLPAMASSVNVSSSFTEWNLVYKKPHKYQKF